MPFEIEDHTVPHFKAPVSAKVGPGGLKCGDRAVVVAGAEGADAPVNFEQRVHAPLNFQPF